MSNIFLSLDLPAPFKWIDDGIVLYWRMIKLTHNHRLAGDRIKRTASFVLLALGLAFIYFGLWPAQPDRLEPGDRDLKLGTLIGLFD